VTHGTLSIPNRYAKMNSPYIQSITLSLPANMTNGVTKKLREYFRFQNIGKYFKYGNTVLLMINATGFYFNYAESLWDIVAQYFCELQNCGIISPELSASHVRIHEINLRFDIPIPNAIFCKTDGFRKINSNTYRSTDYRQYKRKNDESKGIQQSFLTVLHNESGSSVILSFSGRYCEHISLDSLLVSFNTFINCLISLGSIYLTQATNPDNFIIARGYVPFLPIPFKSMLNNANWFNGKYHRKNITADFIGGLYNDI